MIKSITPQELHRLAQQRPIELVDVRTPEEFAEVRAEYARNLPLDLLVPEELAASRKLDREEPIYLICHLGGRSGKACEMMIAAGHANVVNVDGGTEAWVEGGLPVARGQ